MHEVEHVATSAVHDKVFDLVVVGAGIAGLAIAEIFQRSGHSVALIEKNAKVALEASGAHHEWFHFGSLYSIFLSNQFMRTLVGGIDDLLKYYADFSNMNIRIGSGGKLEVPYTESSWIRDEPIDYIVTARNDPDFLLSRFDGAVDYAKKLLFLLTWEMAIKQFIARHQRFHKFDWRSGQASEWVPKAGWTDYSREVIFHVIGLDARLNPHTHFRVPGFDRPMNAAGIVEDLLASFVAHGGVLMLGTEATGFQSPAMDEIRIDRKGGAPVRGRKVIFTSGYGLQRFLQGTGSKLTVMASPLLVVYPQVCAQNFVRLTPFMQKTVNHLHHKVAGESYSLIGGGFFADAGDEKGVAQAEQDLVGMARGVFPKIAGAELVKAYQGYKVELVSHGRERNYQYQLKKFADNAYFAIPGKFSLGFSLAVNTYRRIVGSEPSLRLRVAPKVDVSDCLGLAGHRQIIREYLEVRRHGEVSGLDSGNCSGLSASV